MATIKLPLKTFIECFPLPQKNVTLHGYRSDSSVLDNLDLSKTSTLNLQRKVYQQITLTTRDAEGNLEQSEISAEFPGRFQMLPYDPVTGDNSADHVYNTVSDLVASFPTYAQIHREFDIESQNLPEVRLQEYDVIKLLRLVFRFNMKLLECRRRNQTRLFYLPMNCEGHFKALPDMNEYTVADLTNLVPRKRRLQQAVSSAKAHHIPGLPSATQEVFMEEPEVFIEANPVHDPDLILGLPGNLNVTVSTVQEKTHKRSYFYNFIRAHKHALPLVAKVTDWREETTVLENHGIKPGSELIIHGWTLQPKILAEARNLKYAVPLMYPGTFKIRPQRFRGVYELYRACPEHNLKVTHLVASGINCPVKVGDIIKVYREGLVNQNKFNVIPHLSYVQCDILAPRKCCNVKLSMNLNITFEEVLSNDRSGLYPIKKLQSRVEDHDLSVELQQLNSQLNASQVDLPLKTLIDLRRVIHEPAVLASVDTLDAPAFHLPLRTRLFVDQVEQLDKEDSPLLTNQKPRLSLYDRQPEVLPDDVYVTMLTHNDDDVRSVTSYSTYSKRSSWSGKNFDNRMITMQNDATFNGRPMHSTTICV